jgi:hypothetical protein
VISLPESICPLCSHVFANELLHNHIASEYPRVRQSTTEVILAYHPDQSRFESSLGVIGSHSSMTNDHFSILNFQFTSKDRWPSPLMQPQQNLACLQRLLVFKDSTPPCLTSNERI